MRGGRDGTLRYVRHGMTAPNLARVRCGGDLDVPLLEQGREQARLTGRRLARLDPPIGLIITSDLRRTRETARLIAAELSGRSGFAGRPEPPRGAGRATGPDLGAHGTVEVRVVPAFAERRLGEWNLLPTEETQPWLDAGLTPPGGETAEEFSLRVGRAVQAVKPWLHLHPLLVGSKGVARVLGLMVGLPTRLELGNAELAEFNLADLRCLETTWGTL